MSENCEICGGKFTHQNWKCQVTMEDVPDMDSLDGAYYKKAQKICWVCSNEIEIFIKELCSHHILGELEQHFDEMDV